eukprot:6360481-Lingulodinium_polyedra.AAC.1
MPGRSVPSPRCRWSCARISSKLCSAPSGGVIPRRLVPLAGTRAPSRRPPQSRAPCDKSFM